MALSPRLELKLSQSLVMTPQLQQAIKLLQYSNIDLQEFVSQEIEQNPFLESGDTSSNGQDEPSFKEATDQSTGDDYNNSDQPVTSDIQISDEGYNSASQDTPLDTDYDNVYNNDSVTDDINHDVPYQNDLSLSSKSLMNNGGGFNFDDDMSFDIKSEAEHNLSEILNGQLNATPCSSDLKMIINYLIGMLDEAGYLLEPLVKIADNLGTTEDQVSQALAIAQGFEPVGVFARDLKECLKIRPPFFIKCVMSVFRLALL